MWYCVVWWLVRSDEGRKVYMLRMARSVPHPFHPFTASSSSFHMSPTSLKTTDCQAKIILLLSLFGLIWAWQTCCWEEESDWLAQAHKGRKCPAVFIRSVPSLIRHVFLIEKDKSKNGRKWSNACLSTRCFLIQWKSSLVATKTTLWSSLLNSFLSWSIAVLKNLDKHCILNSNNKFDGGVWGALVTLNKYLPS